MKLRSIASLAVLSALVTSTAHAQLDQIQSWETPHQGWLEPTLLSSYVARSDNTYDHFGKSVSKKGLQAHSLELEYGLTDRATVGAYADFEDAKQVGFKYTRARFDLRYRFFERYQRILDPALYIEYYVPRMAYQDPEQLEVKMILEHDFGDLRMTLNPGVTRTMSGDSVTAGLRGELLGGLYYRRFYAIQPGVELHSELGPLRHFDPASEQSRLIVPTVNVQFPSGLILHVAAGFGTTHASDKLTLHTYLTYEFPTVRPSAQAQ